MQKLAIIADIHGNVAALEGVLADIEAAGVTDIVNLGDCVSGPLWRRETMAVLQRLALPPCAVTTTAGSGKSSEPGTFGCVCLQPADGGADRKPRPPAAAAAAQCRHPRRAWHARQQP